MGEENKVVSDVLCLLYFRAVVIAVIIFPLYSPNKARQLKSFRTEKKKKIANKGRHMQVHTVTKTCAKLISVDAVII